ncbi:DUF1501 domain-containing protein [Polymorphobacter sp. PAMC 29334]|uniref:DUF1501 domain-containing protein n=1 Tax=Polymorphobacter sp. PAMC 29334 TaxID=2862331 RepID=UPI001C748F9C|nr:DUF1501 domain-containing protein [Polymorphobacter sp. PAMC 29334]QYE36601.1 DUF1501 domain-containing protein [Polymorphobacter sp. PAMC 29334]
MDRRSLLKFAAAGLPLAFSGKLFAAPAAGGTRLLVVFLRGAYDAANVTIPLGDFYTRSRPTIGIAHPDPANPLAALPLDANWGLHPALKDSLYPLWAKRQIAFVPFAGTDDMTRSHFETQDTIELGQPIGASRNYASGFMARLAATLSAGTAAPSPIAFTDQVPLSFRGDTPIPNIALGGVGKPGIDDRQAKLISAMYAADPMGKSVSQGFTIRNEVYQSLAGQEVAANRGAVSPKGFELSARRMGRLMATDFNLGFVDVGGWDTHVNQGGATGYLAGRLTELGTGLAGFVEEIGPAAWSNTVVVVVSEFGRTFHENGDKGTDHGHGSSYWVMGGGVKGGRMAGPQVALTEASLNQARDLPVLTDYRALMGGLFARMYGLRSDRLGSVFPGAAASELGLV